jgi:hypothetical protein
MGFRTRAYGPLEASRVASIVSDLVCPPAWAAAQPRKPSPRKMAMGAAMRKTIGSSCQDCGRMNHAAGTTANNPTTKRWPKIQRPARAKIEVKVNAT